MRHGTGGMHFGLYLSAPFAGSVYVNVGASTVPVTSDRPRCYSYPGNKTDRTAAGILAHECGHHVWCRLVETQKHLIAVWNNLVLHVERKADRVSGYEPTPEEAFAESARVYALNPELLKRGSPRRFVFLYADLKLPLPHNVQWQTILAGAAPQIKRQAQNWCNKGEGN